MCEMLKEICVCGGLLWFLFQNIGSEVLLVVFVFGEEERSFEKEGLSQLSYLKTFLQIFEFGEIEDQGMLFLDVLERFLDVNLRYEQIRLCVFKEKVCKVICVDDI